MEAKQGWVKLVGLESIQKHQIRIIPEWFYRESSNVRLYFWMPACAGMTQIFEFGPFRFSIIVFIPPVSSLPQMGVINMGG